MDKNDVHNMDGFGRLETMSWVSLFIGHCCKLHGGSTPFCYEEKLYAEYLPNLKLVKVSIMISSCTVAKAPEFN